MKKKLLLISSILFVAFVWTGVHFAASSSKPSEQMRTMPNLSMTARAKSAYLNRTETTYWVDNKCYGDWKNWTYLCCTIYGTDERKDCEKNAEKGYCISITDKEIEAMKERTKNATAPAC